MDDVFTAMEEEVEKLGLDIGMDDIFLGMTEALLENGELEKEWTYKEKIGKYEFQLHGKVTAGEEEEENCVYVEWVKIGRRTFKINRYF